MVSYGDKRIPRWRTAAILKIVISPYLSEKSSDFDEILYTAEDFELDEPHVIKNEKVALDRLRVSQNVPVFLVILKIEVSSTRQPMGTNPEKGPKSEENDPRVMRMLATGLQCIA